MTQRAFEALKIWVNNTEGRYIAHPVRDLIITEENLDDIDQDDKFNEYKICLDPYNSEYFYGVTGYK